MSTGYSSGVDQPPFSRSSFWLGFSLLLILSAVLLAVFVDKPLSADGVNLFTVSVQRGAPFSQDWRRAFGYAVSELPFTLLLPWLPRDLSVLTKVFGLGLLLPWITALALSVYALRGQSKEVLWWFVFSLSTVNLLSDYILAGEHQVMAVMSWPILFLLVRRQPLTWLDAGILLALLALYSRTYPTIFLTSTLFSGIALSRLLVAQTWKQRLIMTGALFLIALCIWLGMDAVLHPASPGNKEGFSGAILSSLTRPVTIASLVFLVLFFIGWALRRFWLLLAAALIPVAFLSHWLAGDYIFSSGQSFQSRTLTLTLLPLLMLAATFFAVYRSPLPKFGALSASVFVVVLVGFNLSSTLAWNTYRIHFQSHLASASGYLPVEPTGLIRTHQAWPWTFPLMSITWSDGCVGAIVQNPDREGRWEPPTPPEQFRLTDYTCYTNAFAPLPPGVCLCRRDAGEALD